MTLVLNEIHMINGLNETVMIAAADRRLSANGEPVRGAVPSGFQICGYNADFIPEYWLLTNIRQVDQFGAPTEIKAAYKAPAPHFLQDHARREFGWDGVNPESCRNGVKIYRFGDFRSHAAASEPIDEVFRRLSQFPEDFRMPRTLPEYRDYVRFKFEFIAYFYKKWSRHQIIGRPIDVFAWRADARRRTIETV